MKVLIRSNVKLDKDMVELESSSPTIIDLLDKLSRDLPFLRPDKILSTPWVVVSLNQKEITLLPQGLKTPVKDNDELGIAIASFSGGQG